LFAELSDFEELSDLPSVEADVFCLDNFDFAECRGFLDWVCDWAVSSFEDLLADSLGCATLWLDAVFPGFSSFF